MDFHERITLYIEVLREWGIENQVLMVMEEAGELLSALGKAHRGRASSEEIITELADVAIMVEQMAVYFGLSDFRDEKDKKLVRLRQRLESYKKQMR